MDACDGWPHFSRRELACPCCGEMHMDPAFMERLEALRMEYARPIILGSAYRCLAHDRAVRHTVKTGRHAKGRAVDALVWGPNARLLVYLAVKHGFTGIGVAQRGVHGRRFIHIDDDTGPDRPMLFSY